MTAAETVWEAALGRRVVLVEARTWFDARDKARALLGGEPVHCQSITPGADLRPLFAWDWMVHPKRRSHYLRSLYYQHGSSFEGVHWLAPWPE